MSALVPAVLSELVNNREPIGSLKLAIANNDPKYLECNGSVHLVDDYPVLAENLPNILGEAVLLDVTNTRPLDSTNTTTPRWMVKGNRLFVQTLDYGTIKIVENGVEIGSVSVPVFGAIIAYQVFGNAIFCRTSSQVGKSLDNGLTWFWTSSVYTNFPTSPAYGYFQGGAYDSVTDTFVFVTKEAIHKIQGNTAYTYPGDDPANIGRFSSTSITYSDVLFDSSTSKWYICGGVQKTSSTTAFYSHFVIGSVNNTSSWEVFYQEKIIPHSSTRAFKNLIKHNGKFYAISTHSYATNIYVTSDFSEFYTTNVEVTSGFSTDIGLISVNNTVYLLGTAGGRVVEVLDLSNIELPTWLKVSAGTQHNLGIRSDGTLWAWGYNTFGQLGTNSTTSSSTPVQVGTDNDWIDCSAGSISSAAIKSNGTLWTWGNNVLGQLGLGDTIQRLVPTQVPGTTTWSQVAVASGYLSTSPSSSLSLFTLAIDSLGQIHAAGRYPLTSTGVMIAALAAGTSSFQVIENSRVYTEVFPYCAASTTVGARVFATTSSNELYSWGYNGTGSPLGRGVTTANLGIGKVGTTQSWKKVSSNQTNTLAVTTNGELWAWGANTFGQLGTGDTVTKVSPTRVGADTDWDSVSTISYNLTSAITSYALKTNSDLYLAGYRSNFTDFISTGTSTNTTSFILIQSNSGIKKLLDRSSIAYNAGSTFGVIPLSVLTLNNTYASKGSNVFSGTGGTVNSTSPQLSLESPILNFSLPSAEKKVSISTSAVAGATITNNLFYISTYLTSSTGSGTATTHWYKDGTFTAINSGYMHNSSGEVIIEQPAGYSLYKPNTGTFLYYPDYFNSNQIPAILEYNTLGNTTVISSNYNSDGYTYSISGRYIYRTNNGVSWSIAGLNPFYRFSSTISNLVKFNNIYYIVGTGSTGFGRYSTDLYNWEFNSNILPAGTSYGNLYTNGIILVATVANSSAVYVINSNQVRSSVGTPNIPVNMFGSQTEWMFYTIGGSLYRLLNSTISASDTWDLVSKLSGVVNIGYKDGVWVATTSQQILYSTNRGTTWNIANIDASDLGYISITSGSLTVSNSVFVVACNNDSALVSSDGISWKRYIKPSDVSANAFTIATATPESVLLRDETNLRSLLLTPGIPDETRFTLPILRNEDNVSYYVRAK